MLVDRDFLVVQAATRRPRVMSQAQRASLVLELALFLLGLTGMVFLFIAVFYLVLGLEQDRLFYMYIGIFLVLESIVVIISCWPKSCQVLRPMRSESRRRVPLYSEEIGEGEIADAVTDSIETVRLSRSAPQIAERHSGETE